MEVPTHKGGLRTTPETLVHDVEVHDEVDRPHSVSEIRIHLEVSTPLTRLLTTCWSLPSSCTEEVHQLFNEHTTSRVLVLECVVHVVTWSPLRV